jgi:FtsP/CotA-like multicopper oxidase with cupredoxin domain
VWTINGQAHVGDHHGHHPAAFRVPLGRSVRIAFENPTAWWHPMHLHGHHFKVLSRNGEPLTEAAWRDTVLLAPGDRAEVAFVADNPGRWLIHCHVLEHHAGGMGTHFEVMA